MDNVNFIDTDMFIHCLDVDPVLSRAAKQIFNDNRPTAMSSFTLLELKGNYMQYMELLYRKIYDSDSLKIAYAKIKKTGGRKSSLMFAMLIKWIGDFSPHPWKEAKKELLTYLDSQLYTAWESFKRSVDAIYDDFECVRASEEPKEDGDVWKASIPHCTVSNTKCKIAPFMKSFNKELQALIEHINKLNPEMQTQELQKIRDAAEKTINPSSWSEKNTFV